MIVSILITALNEEEYLPALFDDLLSQTYPKEKTEIVLMDSLSIDTTKQLMLEFQKSYKEEYYSIQVLENTRKNQAAGFNVGAVHAKGDCILKIDAHATVPHDFVEENVRVIESGEKVCGGRRPTLIKDSTDMAQTLHLVEESMFGSSIANYRKSNQPTYVKSIFHGMYHREVIETCGLLDERLGRTEDNEYHYRIRQHGYKIKYDPAIESYQYMRPTLFKMLKQKYGNGYWIGLTSHVCRECLSLYHFIPAVFVALLVISLFMCVVTTIPFALLLLTYCIVVLGVSVLTLAQEQAKLTHLLLPVLIVAVHIAYGVGTWVGLIKGFSFRKAYFAQEK